jgi:hypothetical protein
MDKSVMANGTNGFACARLCPRAARAAKLAINAGIVKPVQFQEFAEAVKRGGCFWAVMNELPPGSVGSLRPKTP